ncbi:uncharacterized protein PADG_11997 [Paracoccidioides brasiliensis Pb18]|uniref:Uncharacterized protein n=1 Tax=Paracoccidioides brasiliensis (strain Pb18) TaxID=502780 RepID=A0A0A0HU66_PARBD|nr:uncharacterized protein PADG_11997 [Paracoccidioides brasiliensis Pb18]KGM91858.1 hypothetical protein PADG_11997 [Paracoccidioides brasiliensis Pb18]ODH51697.1 hypothetical protein GX48_02164 [Paracoccidioides brasiliensis]
MAEEECLIQVSSFLLYAAISSSLPSRHDGRKGQWGPRSLGVYHWDLNAGHQTEAREGHNKSPMRL